MGALSDRKIEIVRTIVESAPDRVVGGLQAALLEASGDPVLASVRRLVDVEAHDRRARNFVLGPIAPMCVGDGAAANRLTFPGRALPLVWRALKAEAAVEVEDAVAIMADFRPDETSPDPLDKLMALAAAGLRRREQRDYAAAAGLCDTARPDGAELLAKCLDLGPLVRAATLRLGEWISRVTDENTAAVRIAYKDAVSVADDAGPRFFEMLAAQLAQPWMVLRIISAEMDRPSDKYLASSELASFALRLMDAIDDNLTAISKLDLDGGPPAARAIGRVVEIVTQQIVQLEQGIEINRESAWGSRVARHKQSLASVVESRLREGEKAATESLATQPTRIGKITKAVPLLIVPPVERVVGRAMTLLTFSHEIRTSANYGGFAATRAKVCDKIGEMIDKYVEEVLDMVRHGDADEDLAEQYLQVAANFSALIRDEKAAEIIRRRAHAMRGVEKAENVEIE